MAKKDNEGRLLIPIDIWNSVDFSNYNDNNFGFFITDKSMPAIAHMSLGTEFGYEFIGKCNPDFKHRIIIPENVDIYLGSGDIYYFSSCISQSVIFIHKTTSITVENAKELLASIRDLFNGLDAYLEEDIDD